MNADALNRGRAFDTSLRALADQASSWVADLGVDPWPGRGDEAMLHHQRLQRAIQEARTEAGEMVAILAQDKAP